MKSTQQQKSKKHSFGKDQTTRKSSLLFIQFGLVFALLLTYLAIESKTLVNNDGFGDIPTTPYDIFDEPIPDTTPEKPKQVEPKQKEEPEPVLENLKIDTGSFRYQVIISIKKYYSFVHKKKPLILTEKLNILI